jgi:hypothetical protein
MTQKLEDYAIIGDCETAALVGRDDRLAVLASLRFFGLFR